MAAYERDGSRWAFILAPQLTGRAQKAYMALASDDAGDYYTIKQAILKRYDHGHVATFPDAWIDRGELPELTVLSFPRNYRTCKASRMICGLVSIHGYLCGHSRGKAMTRAAWPGHVLRARRPTAGSRRFRSFHS